MSLKVLKFSETYIAGVGFDIQTHGEQFNFVMYIIRGYVFCVLIGFTTSAITLTYINWPQMDIIGLGAVWMFAGIMVFGIFLSVILKLDAVRSMYTELQQFVNVHGEVVV